MTNTKEYKGELHQICTVVPSATGNFGIFQLKRRFSTKQWVPLWKTTEPKIFGYKISRGPILRKISRVLTFANGLATTISRV